MIVYGDQARTASAGVLLDEIAQDVQRAIVAAGVLRHDALVGALITAGQLQQGVTDREYERRGRDLPSPAERACERLTRALAGAVAASWDSDFTAPSPNVEAPMTAIVGGAPAGELRLKVPEGYAFYALYPEAYLLAAREAQGTMNRVIGLRSIGASLGAMTAIGGGAGESFTVRPTGHPFRRQIEVDAAFRGRLTAGEATLAIVDEGPGLSGSSFGAVADMLEDSGVARQRLAFYTGHGGELGPEASARHRTRWATARRRHVSFERLCLEGPTPRLGAWVADITGAATAPLVDLSGGAWRALAGREDAPVHPSRERRKFLLASERGAFLLKFAGFGAIGERKLAMATSLHRVGFGKEPLGLRRGFLVERWEHRASRVEAGERQQLMRTVGDYIAFRAAAFPAPEEEGGSLNHLAEMGVANFHEAGLEACAERVAAADLPRSGSMIRRVRVDGRLHAWEWLRLGDGRIIKTDALDHHAAHDLIGAQDVGWDIAGAEIELGMTPKESRRLVSRVVEQTGRAVDPSLLALNRLLYLAFQIGQWTLARNEASGADRPLIERLLAGYSAHAERLRDSPVRF